MADCPKKNGDTGKSLVLKFCEMFYERFGTHYLPNFGKEGRLLKTLLAAHGPEAASNLMEKFFEDDSEWVEQAGYTIPVFYSQINKYVSAINGGGQKSLYAKLGAGLSGGHARLSLERGQAPAVEGRQGRLLSLVSADASETSRDVPRQLPHRTSQGSAALELDPGANRSPLAAGATRHEKDG